jgi:serine protease
LRLRTLAWTAGLLALVLAGADWRAGAAAQDPQSLREALRQRPRIDGPVTLDPSALRLTAGRVAAFAEAAARRLNYLPGEVLVKFRAGATPVDQQRALMALRSRPSVGSLRWVGDVAVLHDASQPNSHILAEQLSEQPEVEYAEPNYLARVTPHSWASASPVSVGVGPARTPNDPGYGRQWNFPIIDLPRAWDINDGASSDIIIASIDSGVTTANGTITAPLWTGSAFETVTLPFAVSPDLSASRFVNPYDFVFLQAPGLTMDFDGHGTHTTSTAAESTNNAVGLAGVAYNARIMPVKVCLGYWDLMIVRGVFGVPGFIDENEGGCPFDAIVAGINYAADSGAEVINISLGGDTPSSAIRAAIASAASRGAFVSISMGNAFQVGNPPNYPAVYASDIDGAMSVASVGRSLTRAFYSSTGGHAEIAAPGGSQFDGANFSGLVYQTTLGNAADPDRLVPAFNSYAEVGFQGTSMAAPHVAGTAALIMSQLRGITPAQVEALIRQTARPCSSSTCSVGSGGAQGSRTSEFGFGLIQPRTALFGRGISR